MNKSVSPMRIQLLLLFSFLFHLATYAQERITLKFNDKGKFKIVQFTDVHFKNNNPASDIAIERINEVIKSEKPDLVVFTGDIIYSPPADIAMRTVLEQVSRQQIPFVLTFGNHDDEQQMSRSQLYEVIKNIPYNLLPEYTDTFDFVLPVKSSDGKKNAALLYCMDSNSYAQIKDIGGYGWFTFDQVNWYLEQSKQYTQSNGGEPIPALAFFHIPLPEFNEAIISDNAIVVGKKMERECAPQINTGMFAAMRQSGDVMGVFVGHDHDNDYAVMWKDILLAYGRFTGGDTEYNNIPNGARVIELQEGSRTFTSWIRQKEGEIMYPITYPDSFTKRKR